jgi:hypothetical protein
MQSFNDQTETHSTGPVTDFITLPQDQSEEGNEHDESSMSDKDSVTEQTKIENKNENENSNKNNNEFENANTNDVTTDENRYPHRKRRRNPRYFDEPMDEQMENEEQAMFSTESITFNPQTERMDSSLDEFKSIIIPEFQEAYLTIQKETQEQIDLYLPEPQGIKSMLCLPYKQRSDWLKAYNSELKNLIIDNDTFLIETPNPDEKVIPTKPVFKAKQTQDGKLDKLKVRIVARGDLEKREENEETWSPGTSSSGVRMHLAQAAKAGRTPKQADFIGAYLQARVRGRHFVRLSTELKEQFPEYAKWFGIPLRLKKGIYGLSLSGKWWNEEFTNWLFSDNFDQSKADPTFYVKHYPDGRYIKLIYHTDDMIYYGTDDEIERKFENDIKGKFQISFNGPAQWFLQMRIYAYSCRSISLDQHRYALNIVK